MDSAIQYLQLQPDDDAASVCDRLRFLRGQRVALVWPEHGIVLQRKLDLVLVQREAIRSGVRLALVTHDERIARNAVELNISAFETISSSERSRWKRGRSRAFINRSHRPINAPLADELAPYASRVRGEDAPGSPRAQALLRSVALALLAAAGIGLALALGPSATITLIPASQIVQAGVSITADPAVAQSAIDVENGLIPAITYRAEIEDRGTLPTSGLQELGSTPATGSVTFVNRTSITVAVPAGALVSTSAGTPIIFRTTTDITVPAGAGAQADAPVEAVRESSGAVGNVEVGLINALIGPLSEQLDVLNTSPTFGGEDRSVRVVTEADRDALISMLRQQIQDRAFRDLAPLAADGQFIIPETIRIIEERTDWMSFDHAVGEVADSLTMTMRAVVAVTAVDEALAQQIAYARLGAQVPRGRAVDPGSLTYTQGALSAIDATGRATFDLQVQAAVGAQIDSSALSARLAGMPLDEAAAYLATQLDLQPGSTPAIQLNPEWFGRLPLLPVRISVQILFPEGV
jgi:hypothetical protein